MAALVLFWRLVLFSLVCHYGIQKAAVAQIGINGYAQLHVLLINYTNEPGTLENGQRCTLFGLRECSLSFQFCIEPSGGASGHTMLCNGSFISTGLIIKNKNTLTFDMNGLYGQWYNPHAYSYFTGFTNLTFNAVVYDVNTGNNPRIVDRFKWSFEFSDFSSSQSSVISFVNKNGLRPKTPSKMSLNITLSCPDGWNQTSCNPAISAVPPTHPASKITGAVKLTIQLGTYTTNGKLLNGNSCDFGLSKCDLNFLLCFDTPKRPNPGPIDTCAGTLYDTGSSVMDNSNSVNFLNNHYYGTWFNPHVYMMNDGFEVAYFKVRVFDRIPGKNAIDTLLLTINPTMVNLNNQTSIVTVKGERLTDPTMFTFFLKLSCSNGANGSNCNPSPVTTQKSTPKLTTMAMFTTTTSKLQLFIQPFLPTYWWIVLIIALLVTLLVIGLSISICYCVHRRRHFTKKLRYANSARRPTPSGNLTGTYYASNSQTYTFNGWSTVTEESKNVYIPRAMGNEKMHQSLSIRNNVSAQKKRPVTNGTTFRENSDKDSSLGSSGFIMADFSRGNERIQKHDDMCVTDTKF